MTGRYIIIIYINESNSFEFEREQVSYLTRIPSSRRSQERHLGLNGSNNYWNASSSGLLLAREVVKNRIKRRADVSVRLHNVTSNGRLQLLYSVRVDGKPVLAEAAVKDMRLVTDTEVTAELGHPVLSKAERELN